MYKYTVRLVINQLKLDTKILACTKISLYLNVIKFMLINITYLFETHHLVTMLCTVPSVTPPLIISITITIQFFYVLLSKILRVRSLNNQCASHLDYRYPHYWNPIIHHHWYHHQHLSNWCHHQQYHHDNRLIILLMLTIFWIN